MTGFVRGQCCRLLRAVERLGELRLRVNRGLVPLSTGYEGTGDKGYLEGGKIDSLLTNMVAREGRDKVVDRETHDCGIEERGEGGGEEERMKYQALVDLQLKGNQGCPTERAHGQPTPGPRPRFGVCPVRLHPRIPSIYPTVIRLACADSPA